MEPARRVVAHHGGDGSISVKAEHPTDNAFQVHARFVLSGSDLVLTGLHIRPSNPAGFDDISWTTFGQWPEPPSDTNRKNEGSPPPPRVTAALLRAVSLPRLAEAAQGAIDDAASEVDIWASMTRSEKHELRQAAAGPRGRRKPDGFYAIVAFHYLAAHRRGSTKPAADVASKMGASLGTVNNWIHTARERDLLTRAGQGRSGGSMTDKGRAALCDTSPADKQRHRQGQS